MNAVILSFDSNEKQSVFARENNLTMKRVGAVESESVKSASLIFGERISNLPLKYGKASNITW